MIFIKLYTDGFDESMLTQLVADHTQNIFEGYQSARVVISKDGSPFEIPQDIIRYADNEIIVYAFEEWINEGFYTVGIRATSSSGLRRSRDIINKLRVHPAYGGRDLLTKLIGQRSDEPACIPCTKKKIERLRGGK